MYIKKEGKLLPLIVVFKVIGISFECSLLNKN